MLVCDAVGDLSLRTARSISKHNDIQATYMHDKYKADLFHCGNGIKTLGTAGSLVLQQVDSSTCLLSCICLNSQPVVGIPALYPLFTYGLNCNTCGISSHQNSLWWLSRGRVFKRGLPLAVTQTTGWSPTAVEKDQAF